MNETPSGEDRVVDVPATGEPGPAAAPATPGDQPSVPVDDRAPRGRRSRRARKQGGRPGWLLPVAIALVLALVAAVGYAVYSSANSRNEAIDRLTQATGLLEDADKIVIQVDEVVRSQIGTETSGPAEEAKQQLASAQLDLAECVNLIAEARPDLPEDQIARADALEASAEARMKMLEEAPAVLDANIAASRALEPAAEGWDLVIAADKLMKDAVAQYNAAVKKTGTAAQAEIKKGSELTAQAETKFKEARTRFETAEVALTTAAFEDYLAYIAEKLALVALSKQTDTAFLAGDIAKANEYSNQFNAKDKQAVALAEKLPESPSKAIADAYDQQAGAATKAYMQAREEATDADDALRALDE